MGAENGGLLSGSVLWTNSRIGGTLGGDPGPCLGSRHKGGIMTRRRSIILVAVALVASATFGVSGASAAPPVEADATAVTHWNQVAVSTLAALPGPNGGAPPAFQINMGMTQGAVYDAVNAIGPKEHQPYLLERRVGATASTDAAV